jgi:outer membrane protein assembly factor BamB
MNDGYVYRVDASTGACVWKTYIGRTTATTINFPGCTGGVPAAQIQCPQEHGGTVAFLSGGPGADATTTDFYVPTAYDSVVTGDDPDACGTTSDNRLYALNAATGAPDWVFNADPTSPTPYAATDTPPYQVAAIVGDPVPDMWADDCSPGNRNEVLVGTVDPGTGQDTLLSVSAAPGTQGQLLWSTAGGDIQNPLFPAWGQAKTCGHVYATTTSGDFETIGITPGACGGAAVPCFVGASLPLFTFSGQLGGTQMLWDSSSPTFGKLVVANDSTVYILSDDGPSTSIYCTAQTLQAQFPTLSYAPTALGRSAWFGANDRNGNPAIVGLEVPATAPPAPFDCGASFAAFPQAGTVGEIDTDINFATGARVMYAAVNGAKGSSVVVANFTE